MPFANALKVVLYHLDDDIWELNEPLVYVSEHGKRFEVPRGFLCDLASIPRLPLTYLLFKRADTHRAGVLHDYLCRSKRVRRATADALFLEALRSDGVGAIRARIMWAAVRAYALTISPGAKK